MTENDLVFWTVLTITVLMMAPGAIVLPIYYARRYYRIWKQR